MAVTARVTTLKGSEAGAYYVEALPSYYLDSGEPKGVWHGTGARLLGLEGQVADEQFLRIMAGLTPHGAGDERLGRAYNDTSVRGFDITASAPKSVSVLFAVGEPQIRTEVLAAHDESVAAMLSWVEAHAHTRYRINGQVAVVDAEGIIAATFRQHTSRVLDPQIHTHVVIANRVRSPDGRWLALDARTLKLDQRTLSAIYHSTLRAELTERLGVGWQEPLNGIAEMADVPDAVLEEFSTRTAAVQHRVDEKLDRFIDTMGREPTARERWQLEREAVIDSRPAKHHPADAGSLHAGWVEQLKTLGHRPEQVVRDAINQTRGRDLNPKVLAGTITTAVTCRRPPHRRGPRHHRRGGALGWAHHPGHRPALCRHLTTHPRGGAAAAGRAAGLGISSRPGPHHSRDPGPRRTTPRLGRTPQHPHRHRLR